MSFNIINNLYYFTYYTVIWTTDDENNTISNGEKYRDSFGKRKIITARLTHTHFGSSAESSSNKSVVYWTRVPLSAPSDGEALTTVFAAVVSNR